MSNDQTGQQAQRTINAIRALAMDATQQSGEGHPGMPMGTAPIGYLLFAEFMRHDPKNPAWPNRDRYVQSAGHGSMLQYSLLHLSGYDLPMEELIKHRQLGSKTPGHPEHGHTVGVETTTGPLGQGISTAVGLALAEAHLAARFNRPGFDLFDHRTYVIASDGDMMEGVASEASSFAGHHGLGKLIVFYDDNGVSIDGKTDITFTEDVQARYRAYGWHVQQVSDVNDLAALRSAVQAAQAETGNPSLIAVKTQIGYGSPNLAGTSKAHGSALGTDEVALSKANLGIDWPAFSVPADVNEHMGAVAVRGAAASAAWQELLSAYRSAHPAEAAELDRLLAGALPEGFADGLPAYEVGKSVSTRKASNDSINAIAKRVPELLGGSADLAGSNFTDIDGETAMRAGSYTGRIIRFGIREHAMAAIANGLALSGLRPFVATFLVFSDYLKPALRLSALMEQPVVYVFTHDSIGLGGDGPTHQPIEHVASLRALPNTVVIRPADGNETSQAWEIAMRRTSGPTALALSRQNLPNLDVPAGSVAKGAYVISEAAGGAPEVLLIATGSEVSICLQAQADLESRGVSTRVVSMPSWELFDAQDAAYRESVLPKSVTKRVTVEAGAGMGWHKYAGADGHVVSLDRFGASGNGGDLMKEFGFTSAAVVEAAISLS